MKTPPAFQFYAADFLGGTAAMTAEEAGIYIRLLCHQWVNGHLPCEPQRLGIIGGYCSSTSSLETVLTKFVKGDDGFLRNEKLEKVRREQIAYRNKQAANGAKRWLRNAKPMPSHVLEGMPNGSQTDALSSLTSLLSSPDSQLPNSQPEIPATGQAPNDAQRKKALRRENAKMLLDFLNETAGRSFRATDTNLDLIVSRLSEPDVTPEGCEGMIERQVALWKGTETEEYLQPSTLFGKQKFGGYYDKRDLPVKLETKGNCL